MCNQWQKWPSVWHIHDTKYHQISQAPNGFQDRESFKNVRQWMQEIDKYAPAIVNKMLVATKTDLVSKRVVPRSMGLDKDSMPLTRDE